MPKKGGRKSGGKQAAMTEEERLLYLQQKAQAEEDVAKRKEDILTQFLKDKLQKEEKNSVLNLYKLRQQWRAILTQTKIAELRSDMSVHSQSFERVLDYKDNIIKNLVADLSEGELQLELASSSNLHNMDHLLETHTNQMALLKSNYTAKLEELSSEFNTEREQILLQQQQESEYLENVRFSVEKHWADLETEARRDYQSTCNQIKKQIVEEMQIAKLQMEAAMDKLLKELHQVFNRYTETTRERFIEVATLQTKDEESAKEIDTHKKHIQKMQETISAMLIQLNSGQSGGTSEQLRSDCDEQKQKAENFRVQLGDAQTIHRQRLTKLNIQSSDAAKKLQENVALGERLLRLSEICRTLETEHEQVLPFYKSSLTVEDLRKERENAMEPLEESLAQLMHDYAPLGKFWQRYNKVQLDALSLTREKMLLSQENERLRLYLKQYLDEISISDESFQQQKLLVVSSPSLLVTPVTDRRPRERFVVQEAAVVVHKQL